MKQFRFFLYLNDNDTELTQVYPNYKDDIALDTELENNQRFYRDKLSGKISFLNKPTKDFDFIINQLFDTQYNFIIEITYDYGQTWEREYLGKFYQTDCEINYDDERIDVQPDALDDYVDVLGGLDKEYNLSDLAVEIQPVNLQKRPLIQIYIPGEEIVSCFLSGMAWEQDVREATSDLTKLTSYYKFSFATVIRSMNVKINGTPIEISGTYLQKTANAGPYTGTMQSSNGYRAEVIAQFNPILNKYETIVTIYRNSDNQAFFRGRGAHMLGLQGDETINMTALGGGTGTAIANFETRPVYARYLLDVMSISGVNTYPIHNDDLVENNRNYGRVIGYAIDVTTVSTRFSIEPTKWGKNSVGQYFMPPFGTFGDRFYPIARSRWENVSYWFSFFAFDSILEARGRRSITLRDTYPISYVISTLLKQFAPEITHEPTEEYSNFLYGESNPISYQKFTLLMSQKTNVLNIEYQNPAQKTPMTLQNVLNMLRDCFRCFWYIEDNKLKIEHIYWFKNGGSYSDIPVESYDLTKYLNVRNGKPWDFAQSKITFDKMDMPERFQFKWMDDVTELFEGQPIQILSKYVTPGKIEEINISNFNSDIDYVLLNPDEISNDGFVLMAAVDSNGFVPLGYGDYSFSANNGPSNSFEIKPEFQGKLVQLKVEAETISGTGTTSVMFFDSAGVALPYGFNFLPDGTEKTLNFTIPAGSVRIFVYSFRNITGKFNKLTILGELELPFIQVNVDNTNYDLQNGLLSMTYLQPNYYVYDLPAKRVKINDEETIVQVDRKRKQNVEFPVETKINPMQLVKTSIGLGQIDKVSLNLHNRMTKTTLKYDTE